MNLWIVVLSSFVITAILCAPTTNSPFPFANQKPFDFTNYHFVSVKAPSHQDVLKIHSLALKYNLDLLDDTPTGNRVLLMTSGDRVDDVISALTSENLEPRIEHQNVQELIDEENREESGLKAPRVHPNEFTFAKYMRYNEIANGIFNYYGKNFSNAEVIKMNGTSYYGVDILGVKIANGTDKKPIVFMECGIHAREWISTAFCCYMIHELTVNAHKHKQLLSRYEFHIYPSVNPDGYSNTAVYRFWRKSMRPNKVGCVGTDINRNFDVGPFCGVGTENNSCSEIYCGDAPFSENESRAIRDTVLPLKNRISHYLAFHSFGLMWMFPFSYKDDLAPNHNDLLRKATLGADAITRFSGTFYRVGTIANTIYKVTGSTVDWAYEKAGIKNAYILELQPSQDTRGGFILPPNRIVPTCEETFVGISTLLLAN